MPALQIEDESGNEYWASHTEYDEVAVTDNLTGMVLWVPQEIALSSTDVSPRPFRTPESADYASRHESRITMVRNPAKDTEKALCYTSIMNDEKHCWVPFRRAGNQVLHAMPRVNPFVKQKYVWVDDIPKMVKNNKVPFGVVVKKSAKSATKVAEK